MNRTVRFLYLRHSLREYRGSAPVYLFECTRRERGVPKPYEIVPAVNGWAEHRLVRQQRTERISQILIR